MLCKHINILAQAIGRHTKSKTNLETLAMAQLKMMLTMRLRGRCGDYSRRGLGAAHLTELARHLTAAAAPDEHAVAEARALDALLFAQRPGEDARVTAAEEAVEQAAHEARAQVALLVDLARRAARTAAHLHTRAAVAEAAKQPVRPFTGHRKIIRDSFNAQQALCGGRMLS